MWEQHTHNFTTLSADARTALFGGAPSCTEAELTFEFLLAGKLPTENLLAAQIGPVSLKRRGASTAYDLCALGFDALDLCDLDFAHEAMLVFGTQSILDAFLVSARDAVCLAGSSTAALLEVGTSQLLERCVDSPTEAAAVLQQLPYGNALYDIDIAVVLATGVCAKRLISLGYGIKQLVKQTCASNHDLVMLGFEVA